MCESQLPDVGFGFADELRPRFEILIGFEKAAALTALPYKASVYRWQQYVSRKSQTFRKVKNGRIDAALYHFGLDGAVVN